MSSLIVALLLIRCTSLCCRSFLLTAEPVVKSGEVPMDACEMFMDQHGNGEQKVIGLNDVEVSVLVTAYSIPDQVGINVHLIYGYVPFELVMAVMVSYMINAGNVLWFCWGI